MKLSELVSVIQMKGKWVIEIVSWAIALLFINVGLSKLMDNHTFQIQLGSSPLLKDYTSFIALPLPIIEVIVAGALLTPRFRRFGMTAAFILMLSFTGYATYLVRFAEHIPCGCGGILKNMSWNAHLYFNSAFTLLAGLGMWLLKNKGPVWLKDKRNEVLN